MVLCYGLSSEKVNFLFNYHAEFQKQNVISSKRELLCSYKLMSHIILKIHKLKLQKLHSKMIILLERLPFWGEIKRNAL